MDLNHVNLRVRDPAACRRFYERHFGFRLAFEAENGYFERGEDGFLLALIPAQPHQPLPPGFHVGFGLASPDEVAAMRAELLAADVGATALADYRPDEGYVTFRCWDPDGTEIEVFWETA
jgi:catechol 2,3-dioxygenase-like lactoylglutathione lyase family enzyme